MKTLIKDIILTLILFATFVLIALYGYGSIMWLVDQIGEFPAIILVMLVSVGYWEVMAAAYCWEVK